MGIEPTQPAWKAGTLPLSYTRKQQVGTRQLRNKTDTNILPMQHHNFALYLNYQL